MDIQILPVNPLPPPARAIRNKVWLYFDHIFQYSHLFLRTFADLHCGAFVEIGASSISDLTCDTEYKLNLTSSGTTCISDGAGGAFLSPSVTCTVREWAVQLHGSGFTDTNGDPLDFTDAEYTNQFTADKNGNICAVGSTSGGARGLIIKLDGNGKVTWKKSFTDANISSQIQDVTGTTRFRAATIDDDSNIYFTIETAGNFANNADIANDGNSSSTANLDCAVGKVNEDGDIQWVTQLDDNDAQVNDSSKVDYCGALAIYENSSTGQTDIYVGGYTYGIMEVSGTPPSSPGGKDAFIAKLTGSAGAISWVKQIREDGDANALCTGIATDSSGNIYFASYVSADAINGKTLTGTTDMFTVKYDSSGNLLTIYQHGVTGNTKLNDITIDSSNYLYAAGQTSGNLSGTNSGGDDGFVIKLNSDLVQIWIQQITNADSGVSDASDDQVFRNIKMNSSNQPVIFGYTSGNLIETNSGNYKQPVLLKLANSDGANEWIKHYGDEAELYASADINDISSGIIVQDYGASLGSSLVINPDGSTYFESVIQSGMAFATNRWESGSSSKVSGVDADPWIMKVQESIGDLAPNGP